jgi:hypothetical protein
MQLGFRCLAGDQFFPAETPIRVRLTIFSLHTTLHTYLCTRRQMIGPFHDPCCYRATDKTSVSPYDSEYGFTANHHLFMDGGRPISGTAFREDIQRPVIEDYCVTNTVVDHILGGWRRPFGFDVQSEWISTTANHEWAIWETVRRFASGQVSWVSLASVAKHMNYSSNYRGTRMIGVEATPYLREMGFDNTDKFVRFAELSSEFLWYGRIFPKDVVRVEYWTLEVSTLHVIHRA